MSGKSENRERKIQAILEQKFEKLHISSILKHFIAAKGKYQNSDWEAAVAKSGKFVEAVTKALMRFCGKTIPKARHFRAGVHLRNLEQESASVDDAVRIVIPKSCLFVYEIASNRGARHDPDEVNPNEIDAAVTDICISWVLGEMIRFASRRNKNPEEARELVEMLARKTFPVFENIDGRLYVNIEGLSAEKMAQLILCGHYPSRISENSLCDLIRRHGFSLANAKMACKRVKHLCDIAEAGMKLRGLGRQKAEKVLGDSRPTRLN